MLEDPALERAELRGGLQAQLVQSGTRIAVGGKRIGLAARPVEGEHALGLKALAVRVARDEHIKLADERRVVPALEVGLDTSLEGRQPAFLEACRLDLGEGLVGDVGQCRAAPEGEGFAKRAGLPRGGEALEPLDVELVCLDTDVIAGRTGDDPVGAQDLAERMNVHLQRARGAPGRGFAPDPVDQPIRGDRFVGLEQEQGEQRARPLSAQRQGDAVVSQHLQWPQQAEIHDRLICVLKPTLSRS